MNKEMVGTSVPEFTLPNQDGKTINIKDYLGKPMVIYFYPKDDTPGCTAEACSFRDHYEQFVSAGATVFGISTDSAQSHVRFRNKYKLPFDLLSDKENQVANMFGVSSGLFGLLRGRTTYIVDCDGTIVHVFDSQLNVKKHVSEALKVIGEIGKGENSEV